MGYDPAIGRFLEEDPETYIDGPNEYQFGLSNPVKYDDPTGLDATWNLQVTPSKENNIAPSQYVLPIINQLVNQLDDDDPAIRDIATEALQEIALRFNIQKLLDEYLAKKDEHGPEYEARLNQVKKAQRKGFGVTQGCKDVPPTIKNNGTPKVKVHLPPGTTYRLLNDSDDGYLDIIEESSDDSGIDLTITQYAQPGHAPVIILTGPDFIDGRNANNNQPYLLVIKPAPAPSAKTGQ